MTALITLARPRQWIKNIVVFAGVVFAGRLGDPAFAVRAAAAFAIFCVLSSAIYVFNDLMDVEKDRLHPRKRTRPLASGRVGRPIAAVFLLALVLAGLFAAFRAGPRFGQAAVAFLLLNGMYSLWLKRHAMIDVMCISVSFLIRAIAGVRILQDADPTVALSNWLLLCTFFLALFLGFGKRRSELVLLEGDASEHRASLGEYSVELLDMVISIVTTSAILSFSIYTIWPETIANLGTDKLVYTVPVVMYGFLRYLFLIRERGLGGNPSEILFRDPPLLAGVVAWVVAVVGLLYLR